MLDFLLFFSLTESGQFGKVYKSLYKKPADAGAGIQVAIKIIKKYDSKTETEAFLKK